MAAGRRRILRKEFRQPDRFMLLVRQCLDRILAYRTQLVAVAVGAVVAAAAVSVWQYYRGYRRDLAAQDYDKALREYREGRYEAALESFEGLRARDEPPYDALADLYLANTHMALDRPAEAVATLQSSPRNDGGGFLSQSSPQNDGGGFLSQVRLVALGLAQEMNGSCQDAVRSLDLALDHQGPLRQEAMLGKARCAMRLGKPQDALAAYKAYLEEFPEGETVEVALRMQKLEASIRETP